MTHWTQVKTLAQNEMPSPRWGHALCSVGDSLFLFGGYENSKFYNDLWKFDLSEHKFVPIEQNGQTPPPCSNFSLNVTQDQSKILLFGGMTLDSKKSNALYQFEIATSTWSKLEGNFEEPEPQNRHCHCSEIIGNYLVVFGGECFHHLDDLWLFDLEQYRWIQVQTSKDKIKPKGRKYASSFQYNNRFYLVGGINSKYEPLSNAYYLDMNQFLKTKNLEDLEWHQLKLNNNEGTDRWGHISVVKDNKAYIFGGHKDSQKLVSIDLTTQTCAEVYLIGDPPKGRKKTAACIRNNTLFCYSGFNGTYLKDFFQINLLTKPKYNQKQYFVEDFQAQHKPLTTKRSEKFEIIYDDNKLKLLNKHSRTKRTKFLPNVAIPLTTKLLCNLVSQIKVLNNNKHFKLLTNGPYLQQQFKIFRPAGISEEEYLELVQTFLLYLRLGKINFNQLPTQHPDKLMESLLELADYYAIHHLEHIIKQELLNNFQKVLRCKKGEIKQLVEDAYKLQKYDHQLGQYAGFHTLLKFIKRSYITKVDQLRSKLKNLSILDKQLPWLLELTARYEFQLQQYAFNKSKLESENNFAQLTDQNNQQKDNLQPKEVLNSFHV